jgi:hypothetical protein
LHARARLPGTDNHDVILPFRKPSRARQLSQLIRNGVGINEQTWSAPDLENDGERVAFAERVSAWICEVMGGMRRPYGIDHVAVALACRDSRGKIVCSNALGVMRPMAFYTPEGQDRIAAFLDDVRSVPAGERHEIVGALLSLGDVAFQMQLQKAA